MKTFFQCKEEKWAITRFICFFRKNCTFSDVAMVLSIMSTLMTLYIKILKRIREAIFFHLCPYFFLTVLHIACFHDIIAMFNSYPRCLLLLRYTLKCWSRYNFFFSIYVLTFLTAWQTVSFYDIAMFLPKMSTLNTLYNKSKGIISLSFFLFFFLQLFLSPVNELIHWNFIFMSN